MHIHDYSHLCNPNYVFQPFSWHIMCYQQSNPIYFHYNLTSRWHPSIENESTTSQLIPYVIRIDKMTSGSVYQFMPVCNPSGKMNNSYFIYNICFAKFVSPDWFSFVHWKGFVVFWRRLLPWTGLSFLACYLGAPLGPRCPVPHAYPRSPLSLPFHPWLSSLHELASSSPFYKYNHQHMSIMHSFRLQWYLYFVLGFLMQ